MIHTKSTALLATLPLLLVGCYLDKGDEESFPDYMESGLLTDSPISSMTYQRGDGIDYRTNFQGRFAYQEGDYIRFYIGTFAFPAIPAQPVITPMTLAGTDVISDQRVTNIAYLLQMLDSDNNPENGIEITDSLYGADYLFDFDVSPQEFIQSPEIDDLIWSFFNGEAPDYEQAVDHLYRHHGLRGTWINSDNDEVLNFLEGGQFVYQTAEGYEYGQYTVDHQEGLLNLTVSADYNGDAGTGPQAEIEISQLDAIQLVFSDSNIADSYTRTPYEALALEDTWYFEDTEELADGDPGPAEILDRYLLNLFEGGYYTIARINNNDGGATDMGTYTLTATGIQLTSENESGNALGLLAFEEAARDYRILISDTGLILQSDSGNLRFTRQ